MEYMYRYVMGKNKKEIALVVNTDKTADIMPLVAKALGPMAHDSDANDYKVLRITGKHAIAALIVDKKLDEKALVQEESYARAIADAQIYTNATGIVPPKNGYGNLLDELRWNNVAMLPQMDQYKYARRPHPGGNTLVRNAKGEIENLGRMENDGGQTWIAPDGHVVTIEEYLAGIEGRIAPRHHSSLDGRMSMYHVDDKYMHMSAVTGYRRKHNDAEKQEVLRPIVLINDEHHVYKKMLPAGTPHKLVYHKVPEVGRLHDYGIDATTGVTKEEQHRLEETMKDEIMACLIPQMGKSIMHDTPSRLGYLARHVKQDNGTYRNIKVTCPEVYKDGIVCGGNYLPDTQGNYVCTECGIVYENEQNDVPDEYDADGTEEYEYKYTEETEEELKEDYRQNRPVKDQYELGGKETRQDIQDRLAEKQSAWKKALEAMPCDEAKAKQKAHDTHMTHEECVKTNQEAKKDRKRVDEQRDLYKYKWQAGKMRYAMRCILAVVKNGVTNKTNVIDRLARVVSKQTCKNYIAHLVKTGRLTEVVINRHTTLGIVPVIRPVRDQYPAKYDGRAKYGNLEYKRGTIKAEVGLHPEAEYVMYAYNEAETVTERVQKWKNGTCPAIEASLHDRAEKASKNDLDYPLQKTRTAHTGRWCPKRWAETDAKDAEKETTSVAKAAAYEQEMINRGH